MAVPHADIADLAKLPIFRGFDEEALCLVAGLGDLRNVEAGRTFLHRREKGESIRAMGNETVALKLFLGICRELVDRSREANEQYVVPLAQCGK
jgi:hypothetical protein